MGTITFKIYPELKMAHFKGFGDVSYGMIIDKFRHLHSHPEWQQGFNTFIDFASAMVKTDSESPSRYRRLFEKLEQAAPVRKWAIYTRQDGYGHAAGLHYLLESQSIIVDIFQSQDEALKFLDVPPTMFAARSEPE